MTVKRCREQQQANTCVIHKKAENIPSVVFIVFRQH